MVTEAVAVKIEKLAELAAEKKERKDWRGDRDTLKEAVATAQANAQP